jgi:hypothetical protein
MSKVLIPRDRNETVDKVIAIYQNEVSNDAPSCHVWRFTKEDAEELLEYLKIHRDDTHCMEDMTHILGRRVVSTDSEKTTLSFVKTTNRERVYYREVMHGYRSLA